MVLRHIPYRTNQCFDTVLYLAAVRSKAWVGGF